MSPFDWLEAGYFYYRPSDLYWDDNRKRGQYLDKGFNVKFIYRPKINLPNIAIGLDDFAGTGFFSKEYVVATKDYNNLKFTLGLGWGKFATNNNFKNPLYLISDKFLYRPQVSTEIWNAGSPTTSQWFRGPASAFGGFEYHLPGIRGIKLKIEYDPFDYFDFSAANRPDAIRDLREKNSDLNIGISFPINDFFSIDASFIKGNTFNLNFNIGYEFNENFYTKTKFEPSINKKVDTKSKNSFYNDLLFNLNNNNLFMQTANLDDEGNLQIAISTSQHRNAIRSSSYASKISDKIAQFNDIDVSTIEISHINAGIELNKIKYAVSNLNQDTPIEVLIRNTEFTAGNSSNYLNNEFQPRVKFPVIFSTFNPKIASHVGYPAKFFFGGLDLQYLSEIQFKRNLILSLELSQRLYGNIDDAVSRPDSAMENVRTKIVKYLQEDDLILGRMQLDYIWSPYKNTFAKISGGIFEQMFGGIGGEILYKPFNQNFYIGGEIFKVRQRSYKQRFEFQEYKTITGHLNLGYRFAAGIDANLSFGKYLANDKGYTLDLSRTTLKGFKAGIYFTRTNVSARTFGEGSFDKGFYFQFPLDLFSKNYVGEYTTFKLSPLTRDGGAKLIHDRDLRGLINNSSYYEIFNQWDDYIN